MNSATVAGLIIGAIPIPAYTRHSALTLNPQFSYIYILWYIILYNMFIYIYVILQYLYIPTRHNWFTFTVYNSLIHTLYFLFCYIYITNITTVLDF